MYNFWSRIVLVLLHKRLKSLTILQKTLCDYQNVKLLFHTLDNIIFYLLKYMTVYLYGERKITGFKGDFSKTLII